MRPRYGRGKARPSLRCPCPTSLSVLALCLNGVTDRTESWQPQFDDPEIQTYVFEEAGEEGLELASYIAEHEPIGGVEILEAFPDRKPSAVRKVLYSLMECRVAQYEKDTDAKGWETFTWRLSLNEVKYVLLRRWKDELDHLQAQLRFERDHQFYACAHMHRRMVFEDAMELEFHCPVCTEPMQQIETRQVQSALQERIDELAPRFAA
jgi:transcription initiation factor TFIIE subunit alpha